VLLSLTFSGRQRHDYEKQEENLECEDECVYDRVRNECRRARFSLKKYLHMIEHFITHDSIITLYLLLSPLLQYSLQNFSWVSSMVPRKFQDNNFSLHFFLWRNSPNQA